MSNIEDALKANAEASLALAKAMTFYAETINRYGLKIEQANTGGAEEGEEEAPAKTPAKTETAAQKKKREAAEAKAEAEAKAAEEEAEEEAEDDGFGDDDGEDDTPATLTADDVKTILLKVRDKTGNKADAIAICTKFGYKGIPDIKEKDYAKVYAAAKAKLAS